MTDSKFCEHGVNVGLENPPVFCGQCPPDTIESLRAQLAEVTDELEIMRHQRDQAQSVVDKARELLSYDWQCRLEDCEVGDSARNDARELEHAIAEWDRAMGCDE